MSKFLKPDMIECNTNSETSNGFNMLVRCKCGGKAPIYSRQNISNEVWKIYCQCKNSECNRSFAVLCSEAEEIRPSELSHALQIQQLLDNLPKHQREAFLKTQLKKAS
ncbi:ogr/Delta-like zinc finger family protein [Pseudomonas sp. HK3]